MDFYETGDVSLSGTFKMTANNDAFDSSQGSFDRNSIAHQGELGSIQGDRSLAATLSDGWCVSTKAVRLCVDL
jgi:hypothetical protein